MTTITLDNPISGGRLEELVDRLLAGLFREEPEQETAAPSLIRTVHEGRRLRQAGDLDGALTVFKGVDTTGDPDSELRWFYSEWLDIARRRFAGENAALYSPDTGQAAVLVPTGYGDATLRVVAVLGMRWPVGKTVSRRSLRGLKALAKGGGSWS